MGLKELLKYLIMILGLLGVVVIFIYPVFEGWRPDRVYSRKNWQEYTLGVWKPEKGLMTLLDRNSKLQVVNFVGRKPQLLTYKIRLGIGWSQEREKLCPGDKVMMIGRGGLDRFDKIIDFGGGKCDRKKPKLRKRVPEPL